jgi:hypothetical protein
MDLKKQTQLNPIADEVLALTAVVRPILLGVVSSLKADVLFEVGGRDNVKLKMLNRLYRPGDGDVGICFEYAVHDAITNQDNRVIGRVADAMKLCNIRSDDPSSLLFGFEKTGAVQLIDTARNILTDKSRALTGIVGQPPKLRSRLSTLAAAFRRQTARQRLPVSIRGLWKADLFIGSTNTQQWVGTSVKVNQSQLEGAAGLRVGIVPARQGVSDNVRFDDSRNLVICPIQYDGDFMQIFYEGWRLVKAFLDADANLPKEVMLPHPVHREVCRLLVERREFPVVDVIDALRVFSQPELLKTDTDSVSLEDVKGDAETSTLVAPLARPLT